MQDLRVRRTNERPGFQLYAEPEDRSWILWVTDDGRPALVREPTAGRAPDAERDGFRGAQRRSPREVRLRVVRCGEGEEFPPATSGWKAGFVAPDDDAWRLVFLEDGEMFLCTPHGPPLFPATPRP